MARLPVAAILVALTACQDRGAARLFTPEETAALEQRVLDQVAAIDQSCVRPELVALMKPDVPCDDEAIEPKDPVFAQDCANKLATEIKAIAAAGVGCSPFQVGVSPDNWGPPERDMWPTRIATLLSQRALAADDTASALHEILDGIRVSQDATRGRVQLMRAVILATMEMKLIATALKLATKKPLSEGDLTALTAKVDALIASDPSVVANLRGEVVYDALHLGVVAIKGPFWMPPGGRSLLLPPRWYPVDHPEDVGATIISGQLWFDEQLTRFCDDDNLATCFLALKIVVPSEPADVAAEVQGAGTLLAFEGSEEMRVPLQRRVIARSKDGLGGYDIVFGQRARIVTGLAALRMQLDALRSRKCPMLDPNAIGRYYVRDGVAPRQLGDRVQVQPVDGGIDVLPPVWLPKQKPVARVSCP